MLEDFTPKTFEMKKSNLYACWAVFASLLLWLANAAGPGNVQGIDRTGSPLSPGACDACHFGGGFNPSITAELLDGGVAVTQYEANKSYTLRVRINTAVSPNRYGFQAVALTGTGNLNAGAFGTPPTGFRKTTILGREYAEHSSPRNSNTMEFSWTSPPALGETIRFYAAGIAANNNGDSSGDSPVQLSGPLLISPLTSNSGEALAQRLKLRVLGNPAGESLRLGLHNPEGAPFRFALYTLDGRRAWSAAQWLPEGEQILEWETAGLPGGVYVLFAESRAGIASVKVLR